VRFYGFPDEVRNYFQKTDWLADLALALEKQLARIEYVGPLRLYAERSYLWSGEKPLNVGKLGELAVPAILAAEAAHRQFGRGQGKGRRYETFPQVVARWLKQLGVIDSFSVAQISPTRKEYEVRVRRTPQSTEVLITDVGVGVSQVLPVVVQCFYAAEGSTVIFEQPEIHLHPRVQADLADVLIEAAKENRVQFIVESHSEHFLRRLQRRVAEETLTKDDVALYVCDVAEGKSTIESLKVDEYGNIRNWPRDFFGDEVGDLAAMTEAAFKRRKKK
jgi:predicted ATPase